MFFTMLWNPKDILHAQEPNSANSKIKAIFMYNFTKYVEWPGNYHQGDFVIGILGATSLSTELEKMSQKCKVGLQPFKIMRYNNVTEIGKCHILYIANEKSSSLSSALTKVKNHSTLIVTESEGLALKGSAINFVSVNSKQRFELSKSNAGRYGLQVSSSLNALAIMID